MNPHQKNKIDISVRPFFRNSKNNNAESRQSLSEEEQKVFRLYGKLPNKKDLFQNKLKVNLAATFQEHKMTNFTCQERKYFDSGDYAMSKAGKASEGGVTSIGREHPLPENIPHLSSPGPNATTNTVNTGVNVSNVPGGNNGSPVKESSFLQRETSADEPSILSPKSPKSPENKDAHTPQAQQGAPIIRQD